MSAFSHLSLMSHISSWRMPRPALIHWTAFGPYCCLSPIESRCTIPPCDISGAKIDHIDPFVAQSEKGRLLSGGLAGTSGGGGAHLHCCLRIGLFHPYTFSKQSQLLTRGVASEKRQDKPRRMASSVGIPSRISSISPSPDLSPLSLALPEPCTHTHTFMAYVTV